MRPQVKAKAAAFVLLVAVSEGFYSVSPFNDHVHHVCLWPSLGTQQQYLMSATNYRVVCPNRSMSFVATGQVVHESGLPMKPVPVLTTSLI